MSYYGNEQWPAATGASQGAASWEHQTPPARSGASSAVPREDSTAFASQIEEVDRAIENLFKSGKAFPVSGGRRESMPMGGPRGGFPEQYGGGPRHHSVSDFSGGDARTYSPSNLQSFYATQRHSHGGHGAHGGQHQPSRASEAEQVMQAKRRMAAQRERELRNYHQEQQYNRSVLAEISTFGPTGNGKPASPAGSASASAGAASASGSISGRALSPAVGAPAINAPIGAPLGVDEQRELIARQRSALYGEDGGNGYVDENGNLVQRQAGGLRAGGLGGLGRASPLAFQAPNVPALNAEGEAQREGKQEQGDKGQNGTGSSPVGGEKDSGHGERLSAGAPKTTAPIGTRPAAGSANSNSKTPRATTPLPSPLSWSDNKENPSKTDAAASASQDGRNSGWGQNNSNKGSGAVWGNNKLGSGVQASVWG